MKRSGCGSASASRWRSTRRASTCSTRRPVRLCASALVVVASCFFAVTGSTGAGTRRPPAPPRGADLARITQPPLRAALASQRIYFVMTDRYANGDPANDRGGLSGSRAVTGFDQTDTGYFHGGDLAGLTGDCTGPRGLARVKDLGFTAIWVTPPFGQKYV